MKRVIRWRILLNSGHVFNAYSCEGWKRIENNTENPYFLFQRWKGEQLIEELAGTLTNCTISIFYT